MNGNAEYPAGYWARGYIKEATPEEIRKIVEKNGHPKSGCPLNRGQIRLISYIRGKEILSLNRDVPKSGVPKSGSDCIFQQRIHYPADESTVCSFDSKPFHIS
eukprot:sb/3478196/